jgi:hypothetical protein
MRSSAQERRAALWQIAALILLGLVLAIAAAWRASQS